VCIVHSIIMRRRLCCQIGLWQVAHTASISAPPYTAELRRWIEQIFHKWIDSSKNKSTDWSYRQLWYKSAMRNANKCWKIPYSSMVKKMKNLIWNPHADPDHHQKLIISRGSRLVRACQVWSTYVSTFISYPVYRMTAILS